MMLTDRPGWAALVRHHTVIESQQMRDWFAADASDAPTRAQRMSLEAAGVFLDYSKNRVTDETLGLLVQLARETGVEARRDAMFRGEHLNTTEDRAVLHTALRAADGEAFHDGTEDVSQTVRHSLSRMEDFCNAVRDGRWRGASGQPVRHIVNIGIGGSDLGPRMVCEALRAHGASFLTMHFISNIDATELAHTLRDIDPASTLVIVCSKTFSTLETMTNAHSMRGWFIGHGVPEHALNKHFVAVSNHIEAAEAFGIARENVFEFGEWVGGRYSLWSPVGLPIMLFLGPDNFRALLHGAHAMDTHFRTAPLARNMPVILGLLGIWYRNFFGAQTLSIAPYTDMLRFLPPYLQQLDMESNGKSVQLDGTPVGWQTSPVLWGQPGTNGQHAYFQMLHQGTTLVPVDFIAVLTPPCGWAEHHRKLLANCFAQSEALMKGGSMSDKHNGGGPLAAHRHFPGNRPSNTLLLHTLDPESLGALIALYEHKVFVQAAIWNINAFDQWGVELGKVLCRAIDPELADPSTLAPGSHDSSTTALIRRAAAALATDAEAASGSPPASGG